MGFIDVNLKTLIEIEPKLVQRLSCFQDSRGIQATDDGGLVVSTESGQPVLFPGFNASPSVLRLSGYGHLKDSDVVVVFGFGVGSHVKELVQATSRKTFILVIDPSLDLFFHALKLNDLTDLFNVDRLSLAIGEEPYQATRVRLEKYFGVFTLKKIKIFHCPPAVQLASDYFDRINDCIKEISHVAAKNRDTLSRFSGIWHHHILENLPEILENPGINQLFGKFSEKPAIIISAGPSLDKNVKWLAAAKGKAVLICVDTALKALRKNGIAPDFLVCLDALEINFMHVANEKTDDICLVVNPVTYPQILKNHKGKIFMMTFNDPFMGWIEKSIGEKGNAVTGGSVATAAFDFARKIGASPVLLVGQDLAFTDKRVYTNNSYYCEKWIDSFDSLNSLDDFQVKRIEQEPSLYEKSCTGGETVTTLKMISWKRWFETMIAKENVRCIHATEGGLNIKGAEVLQLKEAIIINCKEEFQVGRILEEVECQLKDESMIDLLQRMKSLNNKIEKIERVCKEGIALATSLLIQTRKKGPDRRKLQNGMTRLGHLASNILSEGEFLELNKWSIDVLIEKMQEHKSKARNGPVQASLVSYQILLGGIGNICKTFGRKLDGSISFLKQRTGAS